MPVLGWAHRLQAARPDLLPDPHGRSSCTLPGEAAAEPFVGTGHRPDRQSGPSPLVVSDQQTLVRPGGRAHIALTRTVIGQAHPTLSRALASRGSNGASINPGKFGI